MAPTFGTDVTELDNAGAEHRFGSESIAGPRGRAHPAGVATAAVRTTSAKTGSERVPNDILRRMWVPRRRHPRAERVAGSTAVGAPRRGSQGVARPTSRKYVSWTALALITVQRFCYGTGTIGPSGEGSLGGAHSDDENISVRGLLKLVEYTWDTVLEIATH